MMLNWVAEEMGAKTARRGERVQSLWSGYGEVVRVHLEGGDRDRVIVKRVEPPASEETMSHRRKLRSYDVEMCWYRDWSARLTSARVPAFFGGTRGDERWCFLLEDLDAAGYAERRRRLSATDINDCLSWLAHFHATFLGVEPEGLWETGTYWHLATRPDELERTDRALREHASRIDARLSSARFQTFVHGDAKAANFCFGEAGVAAVDFQYIGGGCGMKDVAYLLSGLDDRALERRGAQHLTHYFTSLRAALDGRGGVDADALEVEWRALYPWAWADFMRFLAGWSPGYFASSGYGQTMLKKALRSS